MQQTSPKTIIMSSNGTATTKGFIFDWSSLVQGIILAILVACCAFLWNMNSSMAVLQEKQNQDQKHRENLQLDLNQVKLDIRDLRDRAIRAEKAVTN